MGVRKNAVTMSDDEIAAFLEAILKLKGNRMPEKTAFSAYDQFVALHGAVMSVRTPTSGNQTINFAHNNIGFLPWHRQYLRKFEEALNAEVEGVTIPYWDWADDIGAASRLFAPDFLSSRHWGIPQPVTDGMLRFTVPLAQRPSWWPTALPGYRVDALLEERQGRALARGSMERDWPPSRARLRALTEVNQSLDNRHPLWVFWSILEYGSQNLPQTHNAGHRFIGGHMGGAFSPNDPIFWLHHANVDRLWDAWQQKRIASGLSSDYKDTWPDDAEVSPIHGRQPPEGHKLNDSMWPWVGGAAGYMSTSVSQAVRNRLPTISSRVTVREVLNSSALGISYEPILAP